MYRRASLELLARIALLCFSCFFVSLGYVCVYVKKVMSVKNVANALLPSSCVCILYYHNPIVDHDTLHFSGKLFRCSQLRA